MGDERLQWQRLSRQLNIKSNELQKTAKRTLNDEEQEAVCLRLRQCANVWVGAQAESVASWLRLILAASIALAALIGQKLNAQMEIMAIDDARSAGYTIRGQRRVYELQIQRERVERDYLYSSDDNDG